MLVQPRADGRRSTVTVEVAGQRLDEFQPAEGYVTRVYRVPESVHRGRPRSEVVVSVRPADPADIAINRLDWRPVR